MVQKAVICLVFLSVFTIKAWAQDDVPSVNVPNSTDRDIPAGWVLTGSNPLDYAVGTDMLESASGQSSAYLKSISSKPVGFVNLMQLIKSNNFRGQRVRLSASIKVKFVNGWAAMWMRVEDILGRPLAYDDMSNRPIIGSSEWTKYEIVLDIPNNSDQISFGLILNGRGQVWIDNVKLLVVRNEVPTTDLLPKKTDPFYPQNMDFEE